MIWQMCSRLEYVDFEAHEGPANKGSYACRTAQFTFSTRQLRRDWGGYESLLLGEVKAPEAVEQVNYY